MFREEAIAFLKEVLKEDSIVEFRLNYPYESIPVKIREDKIYKLLFEVEQQRFIEHVVKIIKNNLSEVVMSYTNIEEVNFIDDIEDYLFDIEKLEELQIEFDKSPIEEKENSVLFFQITFIRELEDKIINRAILLKNVHDKIVAYRNEVANEISNLKYWEGE